MMNRSDIYLYISNVLIMMPAMASFVYIFPIERLCWEPWVIILFILPFIKYFSPKDYRSKVYFLAAIVILLYILLSDLVLVDHITFFSSGLFTYPIDSTNFTPFLFTLTTGAVFILLFEGILSRKTSRTITYMVISTASTVYMIATITFSLMVFKNAPLNDVTVYHAYEITGILIYLNVYLLLYKGYEFITLLLQPNSFVTTFLTATFVISIVGLVMNLYLAEENKSRKSLEFLAYPVLSGAIFSLALTFFLFYIPFSIYSLFITSFTVIFFMFLVKRSDRKENYQLRIMEENAIIEDRT
ncbi:MAG: hypothetical protein ACYCSO_04665 [Cuniculiplasma sp.]